MASNITLYDSEGNPQELTGDDIAQMGGMPVGGLINFGGVTAPAGFLVCDGTEVAQATYPDLYGAIGDVWGVAVDPLNFVLPDVAPEFVNDLVCIKAIHAVENLALVNVTQLMNVMNGYHNNITALELLDSNTLLYQQVEFSGSDNEDIINIFTLRASIEHSITTVVFECVIGSSIVRISATCKWSPPTNSTNTCLALFENQTALDTVTLRTNSYGIETQSNLSVLVDGATFQYGSVRLISFYTRNGDGSVSSLGVVYPAATPPDMNDGITVEKRIM